MPSAAAYLGRRGIAIGHVDAAESRASNAAATRIAAIAANVTGSPGVTPKSNERIARLSSDGRSRWSPVRSIHPVGATSVVLPSFFSTTTV